MPLKIRNIQVISIYNINFQDAVLKALNFKLFETVGVSKSLYFPLFGTPTTKAVGTESGGLEPTVKT